VQSSTDKGVAWVTGASSGIGRELAKRLAQQGLQVAASARTARELDRLAAEVPGRITAFLLDVTSEKACAETAALIAASLGPIDLMILSAGAGFPVSVQNFSVQNFRRTVDLNLMGVVNCMGPVVPTMLARRTGHIAILASIAGFVGVPGSGAYGATKAALISLCESMKPDFDRAGVTLTLINPGFVKTPLTAANKYPMPFIIPLARAADIIMRGLDRKQFEIIFPWQAALFARLLRLMPRWLLFRVTSRIGGFR